MNDGQLMVWLLLLSFAPLLPLLPPQINSFISVSVLPPSIPRPPPLFLLILACLSEEAMYIHPILFSNGLNP